MISIKKTPPDEIRQGWFSYLTRESQARPTKNPVTEIAKTAITPKRVVAVPKAVVMVDIKEAPPEGIRWGWFSYLTRESQARPTKKPVTEIARTAITPKRVVAVPIAVVISAMILKH
jgi:hypothetical protein